MFYFRERQSGLLIPSLFAVALYFSLFAFQVLVGENNRRRVAYLERVQFQREARRRAELRRFCRMEKERRVREAIRRFKPRLADGRVLELAEIICEAGDAYNYDPVLLLAVIQRESSFRHRAVSRAGAVGLMQIRPFVGRDLAVEANIPWEGRKTLFDPRANVRLGAYYLNKLSRSFGGDLQLALEAYYNGPARVRRRVKARGSYATSYSRRVITTYRKLKNEIRT